MVDALRMPQPGSREFSPRWVTFAGAALANVTGLKTSVATVAAPTVYNTLGAFNGAQGPRLFNGIGPAFTLSVHNSASAAAYNFGAANQIVIAGWWNGKVVSQAYQLTTANGGENLLLGPTGLPVQPFDKVDSISIPAQVSAAGAWTFGVQDLVAPSGGNFRYFRANGAGNFALRYGSDPNNDDTIPLASGERLEAVFSRVLAATTVGFSVGY